MAGALGVRLGGRNVYFGRSEVRPFLGDGPRPEARHLKRAARISGAVGVAALGLAASYPSGRAAGRCRRPVCTARVRGPWPPRRVRASRRFRRRTRRRGGWRARAPGDGRGCGVGRGGAGSGR